MLLKVKCFKTCLRMLQHNLCRRHALDGNEWMGKIHLGGLTMVGSNVTVKILEFRCTLTSLMRPFSEKEYSSR